VRLFVCPIYALVTQKRKVANKFKFDAQGAYEVVQNCMLVFNCISIQECVAKRKFVRFIDTGFRKCDLYKHVQSANIGVKCVTFVSETFTRYGSNTTNVW